MYLNASSFKTQTALDAFSIQVANSLDGFAALKIFTPFYVPKSTFKWYQYTKDNLRLEKLHAPSGSEAAVVNYSVITNTSTLVEHAVKHIVLEKDARDFDRAVADLRQDAAAGNMERLMIELEDAAHTKLTTAGNYPAALTSTLGATATWAVDGGNPLEDIRLAKHAVFLQCGKVPNAMALSFQGMEYLRNHPQIRDAVKYTQAGPPSNQQIAAFLGLGEIIVSSAIYNSATEGAADSLGAIWQDDALIFVKDDSQALRSMSYGRCFMGQNLYSKDIDAPELGRSLGASFLETGWEWALEFAAQAGESDGDAIAGYFLQNIF